MSLESVILGDFADSYDGDKSDPIRYLFRRADYNLDNENLREKEALALYRGFYMEGRNLQNKCKKFLVFCRNQ